MNMLRLAIALVALAATTNAVPWLSHYTGIPGSTCSSQVGSGSGMRATFFPLDVCVRNSVTSSYIRYKESDTVIAYANATDGTCSSGRKVQSRVRLGKCTTQRVNGKMIGNVNRYHTTPLTFGSFDRVALHYSDSKCLESTLTFVTVNFAVKCNGPTACLQGKRTVCGNKYTLPANLAPTEPPKPPTLPPTTPPTPGLPLVGGITGTNLEEITDYSSNNWALTNVFKASRDWISGDCVTGAWSFDAPLALDANGYVTALPSPQCARTLVLWESGGFPTGDWVLTWDGTGTWNFDIVNGAVVSVAPGRIVLNFVSSAGEHSNGVRMDLVTVDPNNYPKNIQFRHSSLENFKGTWNPNFVSSLNYYSTLRFMDMMKTNGNMLSSWSQRAQLSDARWTMGGGVPVEALVELSNQLGQHPWFCVPIRADDDYVLQLAQLVKQTLNSNLKPFVELSNEVWNWGFPQASYARSQAEANTDKYGPINTSNWMKWYGERAAQVQQVFGRVWAKGTFVRVVGAQSGWPDLNEDTLSFLNNYQSFDVVAIAPYLGNGVKATSSMTEQSVLDLLATTCMDEVKDQITRNAEIAKKYGLPLVAYEGGQHLTVLEREEGMPEDTANQLFKNVQTLPKMKEVYDSYLALWKQLTNGALFNHFLHTGNWGRYGYWGARENLAQPVDASFPKALSLYNYAQANKN